MGRVLSEEKLQLARDFETGQYKVGEFCELHDIKKQNLYYWRRKLRELEEEDQNLFLPIKLDAAGSMPGLLMEIRMPNGIQISFSELVPVGYVNELLAKW